MAALWQRLLGAPADRRIWLQEIGAPTPWVPAEGAASFADASIRGALGNPAVEAVTWWCSHDVSRELADFPEVEYSLGLFDAQGRVKPVGEAMADIAREQASGSAPIPPATPAPLLVDGLRLDAANRSLLSPRGEIFTQWVDEALAGSIRPLAAGGDDATERDGIEHNASPVVAR